MKRRTAAVAAGLRPLQRGANSSRNWPPRIALTAAPCVAAEVSSQSVAPSGIPGGAFPVKAIRLIVPFPAGGGADTIARIFAPKLTEAFAQPVIVENRPGGSTIIGGEVVAKAPPDGHTLFMATFTNAVNPALHPKLPWDIQRDFAPVSLLATTAYTLVVHPSLPARTTRDLIALAKARTGQLNFASAGNGAPGHLAGELLNTVAQVKLAHVPYKGAVPALTDVIAGQVPITFGNNIASLPHVLSGRLRALGVTSMGRSAMMPAVPTMIEGGLPNFGVVGWYAIVASAGTPQMTIAKLHAEIMQIARAAEVQRRLASDGSDPVGGTPAGLASFIRTEIEKWSSVVKSARVQAN